VQVHLSYNFISDRGAVELLQAKACAFAFKTCWDRLSELESQHRQVLFNFFLFI
jgi:hypothetical protein